MSFPKGPSALPEGSITWLNRMLAGCAGRMMEPARVPVSPICTTMMLLAKAESMVVSVMSESPLSANTLLTGAGVSGLCGTDVSGGGTGVLAAFWQHTMAVATASRQQTVMIFTKRMVLKSRCLLNLQKSLLRFYAIISLSGVKGRCLNRLPVALNTALATAADTPVMPISPMPRAPNGEI